MLSNVADLLPLSFGKNPQLWVRRFVLLSNVFPMEIIRDFPMSPGINLIVGSGQVQQESSNPKTPFASSGHSVGKTTCCRLLRYLLGEANYGTKKYQEKPGSLARLTLQLRAVLAHRDEKLVQAHGGIHRHLQIISLKKINYLFVQFS